MKKSVFIVLFFIAVLAISTADAAWESIYTFNSDDFECSIHGDIAFKARTLGIDAKTIKIKARFNTDLDYFNVNGKWYDDKDQEIRYFNNGEFVTFRSAGTLFTRSGDYYVHLTYPDTTKEIKISCPKFEFSCNDINIDIQECYSDKNDFVIVFEGKGLETQPVKLNLTSDLEYRILSERQSWNLDSLPLNLNIMNLENETYEMRFPSNSNYSEETNSLKEVEIKVKERLISKPELNSGCNRGEYGKLYPNTADLETKCPTKIQSASNEVITNNIENKSVEETPKTQSTEQNIQTESKSQTSIIILSGIIGIIIGIIVDMLFLNKKR